MEQFVFQFYPVCNFEKFINFGLGAVRSETNFVHFFIHLPVLGTESESLHAVSGFFLNLLCFPTGISMQSRPHAPTFCGI